MLGRFQEALARPARLEPMLGNFELSEPAVVQALAGRPAEARRILAEMEAFRRSRYVGADAFAAVHAVLGETDAAFAELERAYGERSFTLVMSRIEPIFAPLRGDPRWASLMKRLNFP
jgi:hypothetical protein